MKTISKPFVQLWNGFIKIFGDIKVFKWPMFVVYDPGSYQVKGTDMREVIDVIRPGDILLRGYNNYLDGYFIPGYFSHAGLYVGEINQDDEKLIQYPDGKEFFRTGKQMIIHSMAEGVFMEDVLNFCRCDRMVILRLKNPLKKDTAFTRTDIPPELNKNEQDLYKRLIAGEEIDTDKIYGIIREAAISQVGKPYDFQFNFSNYNNLSCTEFVYYCIKSMTPCHGLKPAAKRVLMFNKKIIAPDAFLKANFELVWKSRSVDNKKLKLL